jgi:hypothetical protein
MTQKTLRALLIIRDNNVTSAAEFAALMWPESSGWNRRVKCGNYGVSVGGGMALAGGGLVGKLVKRGLVVRVYAFDRTMRLHLTDAGYRVTQEVPMT